MNCVRTLLIAAIVAIPTAALATFLLLGVGGAGGTGGSNVALNLPTGDVLHFMAPTSSPPSGWSAGSDSNNGLSKSTPWASPNHALNCGDVIIAAPSFNYSAAMGSWGAISNCPSTTGGLAGGPGGGVDMAVLLCGGTDLGTNGCGFTCNSTICNVGLATSLSSNNWAMEGWTISGGGMARVFEVGGCEPTVTNHIAFINDIAFDALQGFTSNGCSGGGGDYIAYVGVIAQNAASDPICLGAVDFVDSGVSDNNPGTHFISDGNFSFANHNASCNEDTEDFLIDSPDNNNVNNQFYEKNNMGWNSDRMCMQVEEQSANPSTPLIIIQNFTCFNNNIDETDNFNGSINMNDASTETYKFNITNNIVFEASATNPNGQPRAAWVWGPPGAASTFTNSGNFYFVAGQTTCNGCSFHDSTFSTASFATSAMLGTSQTFQSPAFQNTADLLANWVGAPNCTGFAFTSACMGWNFSTQTATANTPIFDLTPTATGTSGKGYQPPGPCATDSNWPTWLYGIVGLQFNGSGVVQVQGLVNKPCGV
jgi:hypothetical protein